MNFEQIQKSSKNVLRTIGSLGWLLSVGLLLIAAGLVATAISRNAAIIPNTGSPIRAQSVPEAAVQSVTDYLRLHSSPSAQVVPDASVQSVTDYLGMHSSPSAQTVPEAAVQSVTDYLRAHSSDLPAAASTDPAVKSVMDYLRAHGVQ